MKICHLHVHSEFSFLDSICRLEILVDKAKAMGMESLAITDHFNLSGAIEFYQLASAKGLKPILGAEIIVRRESDYHLTLLAKNNLGYSNLIKLITTAQMRNEKSLYVSWAELQRLSTGLIALSGCEQGEVATQILKGAGAKACYKAREYQNIFGKNNFYLEIIAAFPKSLKESFFRLSELSGVPIVISADVHYINRGDYHLQKKILRLQQISKNVYPLKSEGRYFLNQQEMKEAALNKEEAVINTDLIAQRCQVTFDLTELHLPHFAVPPKHTLDSYLKELCWQRYHRKEGGAKGVVYERRLSWELELIAKTGFAGYFLIVGDIVDFARQNRIPLQARGSSVGSYVGYLLGFSDVDPVEYGLYFERFLNPQRISMPDIDLDICHSGRKTVLKYLRQRYGDQHMAHIAAYSTFAGRAALRGAAKALGYSEVVANKWSSLIKRPHALLQESLQLSKVLQEKYQNDAEFQAVFQLALHFERLPRHLTQHSAGIVLSREPLTNYLPLQYSRDQEVITQMDMHSVEALGLLKIDLLGSRFQSVIHATLLKTLPQSKTVVSKNDDRVYHSLCRGETLGVFQLESTGMRLLLGYLKPNCLKDLIAATSLYRPGPLKSNMALQYIQRRAKQEKVIFPHPKLKSILSESFGTILWQEQVMQTARILADYTLGEADLLRRATAKRIPKEMAKHKNRFIEGCLKNNITGQKAQEIFAILENFSSYCFNKAHAAAYAQLIYQTAYLKTYYPQEYMTALMNMHFFDSGRINRYLAECRRLQISLSAFDINRSNHGFILEHNEIRPGLAMIKHLGTKGVQSILAERQKGCFKSLHDFLQRMQGESSITIRAVESLIKAGAFDQFGRPYDMLWQLPAVLRCLRQQGNANKNLLLACDLKVGALAKIAISPFKKMLWQGEVTNHFIGAHPLDYLDFTNLGVEIIPLSEVFVAPAQQKLVLAGLVTALQVRKSKKGELIFIVELQDQSGSADIVFFSNLIDQDYRFFQGGCFLIIEASKNCQKGLFQLTAQKILQVEKLSQFLADLELKNEGNFRIG